MKVPGGINFLLQSLCEPLVKLRDMADMIQKLHQSLEILVSVLGHYSHNEVHNRFQLLIVQLVLYDEYERSIVEPMTGHNSFYVFAVKIDGTGPSSS